MRQLLLWNEAEEVGSRKREVRAAVRTSRKTSDFPAPTPDLHKRRRPRHDPDAIYSFIPPSAAEWERFCREVLKRPSHDPLRAACAARTPH